MVCEVREDSAVSELADRVRSALQEPYVGLPSHLSITASTGVASGEIRHGALSIDGLIRLADRAMYKAKAHSGTGSSEHDHLAALL